MSIFSWCMKRLEKKKSARRFNVCKKICQLNRVATLFSIQYQEQLFQRQYLSDFYSAKIGSLLDDAWNKSENCYNKIATIYPEVNRKYKQIYGKKYNEVKIDINVFFQSTGEMIERRLSNISKQVEFRKNEINSINQKLDKYNNQNYESEIFDGFVDNLNALVKVQKQRYNSQKMKVYSSLNSKISFLNAESELRIQKMKSETDKQKNSIKYAFSQNFESNDFRQFFNNFLIPLRKRFKHVQFTLKGQDGKFLNYKNNAEKSISSTKAQIFKEIEKIKNLKQKFRSEKKEMSKNISGKDEDLDLLQSELERKTDEFAKEEEKLKIQLFENRQKFENKFQFFELNHKGRLSNVEMIFRDIRKGQANEISSLTSQFNQNEKSAKNRIQQIEKEIRDFDEAKEKIENELNETIIAVRSENLNSINKLNQELEIEKNFLNLDFQQRKSDIYKKTHQFICELNSLNDEKTSSIMRFQSFVDKIENDEKREIENINSNFKFNVSELQTEFSNKLAKLSQKLSESIEKAEIECEKKKNEKINQIEFLLSQEILKAQFNLESSQSNLNSDKKYLNDINTFYSNTYEKLQRELNEISPPNQSGNFALLTVEISSLEKQLKDSIEIIESEKKKLNELFNFRIQNENERHSNKVREQEEILGLIDAIEKTREEKEAKIKELNSFDTRAFDEIQKSFERQRDLIELRYLNRKTLISNKIKFVTNDIESKKADLRNSISELKKSHEIQIKLLQLKYNSILKKQRNLLSHSPNSSGVPFDELYLKKMRAHKEKVKKMRDTIHEVKNSQQLRESEYEHQLFVNMQKHKKNFETNESKMKDELNSIRIKRDELKSSLLNLKSQIGQNKKAADSNQSSSGNERVAKLSSKLNKVNQKLSALVIEYKKCKAAVCATNDGKMRSSLGTSQSVPVLQLTPKHNPLAPNINVT